MLVSYLLVGFLLTQAPVCFAHKRHLDSLTLADAALQDPECAEVPSIPAGDQCEFVKQYCSETESDSLVPYLQIYYCHVKASGWIPSLLLQFAVIVLLVLLFRVLSSTAEEFFSPILTQLSQELGLPPRFAAVTFLALGNGAPDVSASVAAVHDGNYHLALGALFGGGMFVGCVVAGCVTLAAKGVRVRGALLRDVAAYAASAGLVAIMINSKSMTYAKAALLLIFYVVFIIIVFVADIAHILASRMRQRQADVRNALLASETQPLIANDGLEAADEHTGVAGGAPPAKALSIELSDSHGHSEGGAELDSESPLQGHEDTAQSSRLGGVAEGSGRGDDSQGSGEDASDRRDLRRGSWQQPTRRAASQGLPVSQPGAHAKGGGTDSLSYSDTVSMRGSLYRERALAELAHSDTFFRREPLGWVDEFPESSGYEPPPSPQADDQDDPAGVGADVEAGQDAHGDAPTAPMPRGAAFAHAPGDWSEDFRPEAQSRRQRTREVLVRVASQSAERLAWVSRLLSTAGDYLDIMEYPLKVARQATIPMLDVESYDRRWFLTALLLAPTAIALYLHRFSLTAACIAVGSGLVLSLASAYGTMGLDKDMPPSWELGTGFPVGAAVMACLSLTLAAMWVDVIASELVGLIGYLGILARIDHTVLGLTVLAWGNSLGDLSTNLAMAKRGLSNMAITACFAGPMFNMLVALGAGFFWRCSERGSVATVLTASEKFGAGFVILNSLGIMVVGLLYRGKLPDWYGWVQLSVYVIFLITSLMLI